MTNTPIDWLDRARTAELARVRETSGEPLEHIAEAIFEAVAEVIGEEISHAASMRIARVAFAAAAPSAIAPMVRAATLEECAKIVDDFQRQLPIFDDPELDSVSDDAVTVMLHAAAAIRALGAVSDG